MKHRTFVRYGSEEYHLHWRSRSPLSFYPLPFNVEVPRRYEGEGLIHLEWVPLTGRAIFR